MQAACWGWRNGGYHRLRQVLFKGSTVLVAGATIMPDAKACGLE